MNKTLRISFSLKNTYRINTVLFSLKQIPIIKKFLPAKLYQARWLKLSVNIITVIYELISVFLGKFIYLVTMVVGAASLYSTGSMDQLLLHILCLLTIIGSFFNTHLFNPSKDKYYAMILMRMDAREYTLINYGYAQLKIIIGFLPFTLLFGLQYGLPLWLCILMPFAIAGIKAAAAAYSLWDYERRGYAYNENAFHKLIWIFGGLLLLAAYGLPYVGFLLPVPITMFILIAFVIAGIISIRKIIGFQYYREINQELLHQLVSQMDSASGLVKQANEKLISADTAIISKRHGFEYLNELFIKRHQKILWRSTKRIAYASLLLISIAVVSLYVIPEIKKEINQLIMNWLPYFVFIMYSINRGSGFTKALFMNCDHSLLTYSFYKEPKSVLKLFQIRLREITKINLVPAVIIGSGLALILYFSGGSDNPWNYAILLVSVICMSMFFSIHYLTIYYLLQPYNAETELKSGTYQLVMSVTYLVCFFMINLKMPILIFGMMTIVFCIIYCIIASMLIYRLAPKTFRLRN